MEGDRQATRLFAPQHGEFFSIQTAFGKERADNL
jgi:hypothetical protein